MDSLGDGAIDEDGRKNDISSVDEFSHRQGARCKLRCGGDISISCVPKLKSQSTSCPFEEPSLIPIRSSTV